MPTVTKIASVKLSEPIEVIDFQTSLNNYVISEGSVNALVHNCEFLVEQIVGPVAAKSETRGVTPRVEIHETGVSSNHAYKGQAGFVYANNFLANNIERNKLLARQVFKDLRENKKHCIVIPVLRIKQAVDLARMINAQAQYNNRIKDEKWPEKLALAYHRNTDEQEVLKQARLGKRTRVVIAIVKKVAEGTDVPAWTHIYIQHPIANKTNFYQLTQRIMTAVDDKPEPVIRYFVDNIGLSLGCFTFTFFNCILPFKYFVSAEVKEKAFRIIDFHNQRRKLMNIRKSWSS